MRPLLAYYGDDFTGSTDVMEVLQWSGLRTVLFLDAPAPSDLARYAGLRAFGIAGTSRSMTPHQMRQALPAVFDALKRSGARLVHYKTCSTFDSSAEIGSIGCAIELGREVFGQTAVPVVVGAPHLGRYQVFGNLFARSGLGSEPHRLDRHPTMARHPITPMDESDLRRILAQQTKLPLSLINVLELASLPTPEIVQRIEGSKCGAVLLDVLTPDDLMRVGRLLETMLQAEVPRFVVGSSGVESALIRALRESSIATEQLLAVDNRPQFTSVDRLLVLTGSCSPVNARQIDWAEKVGFMTLPIATSQLVDERSAELEIARVVELSLKSLDSGANLLLHSCRGPDDPRKHETHQAMRNLGLDEFEIRRNSGQLLGPKLGRILQRILADRPLRRIGIAGGDTSGFVVRALGIQALEAIAYVAPGSPLCRAHANHDLDGLEMMLKGGQVGQDDIWSTMLTGTQNQFPPAHGSAAVR